MFPFRDGLKEWERTKQLVVKLPGLLYNTNTMEEFKEMDRVELLEKNRNLVRLWLYYCLTFCLLVVGPNYQW